MQQGRAYNSIDKRECSHSRFLGDVKMTVDEIRTHLFELSDEKYAKFQGGLIPDIGQDDFIGVRTPALKAFAKEIVPLYSSAKRLAKTPEAESFLHDLPHTYFDENQLHAFIISIDKDFESCLNKVERFLPFIDNWATCDQLSPAVFRKNRDRLKVNIHSWINDEKVYTVRFGIGCAQRYFLDDGYEEFMPVIAKIRSGEYYINMMRAWYFATALAKQYDAAVKYLEHKRLDGFTHKKTIRKAIESFRVSDEHKKYLKTL